MSDQNVKSQPQQKNYKLIYATGGRNKESKFGSE